MESHKECGICHISKPVENFHKDGRTKDSLRSICIECEIGLLHPDGLKQCSRCKQSKEFKEFRKDRRLPDGLRTDCKICESERKKKEYHTNAETHRMRKRQFYRDHKKERNAYNSKYTQIIPRPYVITSDVTEISMRRNSRYSARHVILPIQIFSKLGQIYAVSVLSD